MTFPRLSGRTVAVTRANAPDDALATALESEGARILSWCCLSILPPASPDALTRALANLDRWDWIVVTSPRAAEALGAPPGTGTTPRIAAVGPQTAAVLESAGWPVALWATGSGALSLGQAMSRLHRLAGSQVLFPAGSRAGTTLEETLTAAGAGVARVEAYRTVLTPPERGCIVSDLARGVDAVTFASPSAVEALGLALKGDLATVLGGTPVVAIGPTTAEPLRKSGVTPVLVARTPGISAMVDAVCEIDWIRAG